MKLLSAYIAIVTCTEMDVGLMMVDADGSGMSQTVPPLESTTEKNAFLETNVTVTLDRDSRTNDQDNSQYHQEMDSYDSSYVSFDSGLELEPCEEEQDELPAYTPTMETQVIFKQGRYLIG